ncbi:hypothetical protein C0583_04800 [Candidatus Parcubacteria bacterium]|nr:MAG: hypothetical protein C0583_04800 [Candidatus Parcubacteria bacterium]
MKIQEILQEIYKIDDDMKNYEKELEKIIQSFIKEKPEVNIDKDFVIRLKNKLMNQEISPREKTKFSFTMPNFVFAGAGAALMFLLMLPFVVDFSTFNKTNLSQNDSWSARIESLQKNAFGSLSSITNSQDGDEFALNESARSITNADALEASDDIAPKQVIRTEEAVGLGGGGTMGADTVSGKMIAPYYNEIEYVYTGDDFDLEGDEDLVYKRVRSNAINNILANGISNVGGGLIDTSNFSDIQVNSLNLVETKEFGYSINFNSYDGAISLYKNYQTWPNVNNKCRDEKCFEQNRLSIEDIPSDDKIIAIADSFLGKYGIDTSVYGEAQMQNDWLSYYERAEDKDNYYIPEEIQLIYPLEIEGQTVYNEDGRASGLTVSVDVRNMKVANVNSIRQNEFVSSVYELENDENKVIEYIESMGNRNYYRGDDVEVNKVQIQLDNPEMILMTYYLYNEEDGSSEELFIPALLFPVVNYEESEYLYGRKYVTVPLVKEIFDEYYQQSTQDDDFIPRPIEPMPLLDREDEVITEEIDEPAKVENDNE